jgi:hypothetical protein
MAVVLVFDKNQAPSWLYYLFGYMLPLATGIIHLLDLSCSKLLVELVFSILNNLIRENHSVLSAFFTKSRP